MNNPIANQISVYINSQSRNKIVFYKEDISEITPIDLGRLLAQSIYNMKDESKLPMRVSFELDEILNAANTEHLNYGRILAISNIGIILEPELKQDFNSLLEKYSKNNVLFVQWDGELDQEYLYFLSKENGIKINIKNLSHIAI